MALSSLLISPKSHSELVSNSKWDPCSLDLFSRALLYFIPCSDMPPSPYYRGWNGKFWKVVQWQKQLRNGGKKGPGKSGQRSSGLLKLGSIRAAKQKGRNNGWELRSNHKQHKVSFVKVQSHRRLSRVPGKAAAGKPQATDMQKENQTWNVCPTGGISSK